MIGRAEKAEFVAQWRTTVAGALVTMTILLLLLVLHNKPLAARVATDISPLIVTWIALWIYVEWLLDSVERKGAARRAAATSSLTPEEREERARWRKHVEGIFGVKP